MIRPHGPELRARIRGRSFSALPGQRPLYKLVLLPHRCRIFIPRLSDIKVSSSEYLVFVLDTSGCGVRDEPRVLHTVQRA